MSTNIIPPEAAEAIGALIDEPGECRRRHGYRIYYGAVGALEPVVFDTAREARVHYDAVPQAREPMWDAFHSNGLSCLRESQHQECLGMRLDEAREAARIPVAAPRPDASLSLLRRVRLPELTDGAMFTATPGPFTLESSMLRVTGRGHWYRPDGWYGTDDHVCRGCGISVPDDPDNVDANLDAQGACPKRPTAQDIASALLGRMAVAA